MSANDYLHGYSRTEQERLVEQAEHWREMLIPVGLSYRQGDRVLEIGCGAGAVLAVLSQTFAGIDVAGIDREERQIEFAREHLERCGVRAPDLVVGDAAALPWPDASFDHVYMMWFVEHLADQAGVMREALRVLKPGGRIAITETDYTGFQAFPSDPDWEVLTKSQYDWFASHGDPVAGRRLGEYLQQAGFVEVRNEIVGFHFFQDGSPHLAAHAEYVARFLELAVEPMAEKLGRGVERLRAGVRHVRSLPARPDGALTQVVFRAHARGPR